MPQPPPPPPLPPPLEPGQLADPIEVGEAALAAALGRAVVPSGGSPSVVWSAADAEVVAHLTPIRVGISEGLVIVAMRLEAQETGTADVTVPFAVGGPRRLAAMFATTERRPRGPADLVDRWGDAVIATLWRGLLAVARSLAANAGTERYGRPLVDKTGQPLIPSQLIAQPGRTLLVVPQARHPLDQVPRA